MNAIDSDSTQSQKEEYIFTENSLIKTIPGYQSKKQRLKLLNNEYKLYEVNGYIFDNRNVFFQYDKNGFIKSEIWYNEKGLENKTEYEYNLDYTERIEQTYDMLGTEKSTRTVQKFNKYGDIIFEQSSYRDNSQGSINTFEYKYDDMGNWLEKKSYYQEMDYRTLKEKILIDHEIREIIYYGGNEKPKKLLLPEIDQQQINSIRRTLPSIAKQKEKEAIEYKKAVETGNFDSIIKKTTAENINEFTPKFWKRVSLVYGNLDEDEENEAVAVYETPLSGNIGNAQNLVIFKKQNNHWKLWHQTFSPILDTSSGGMMGNPYAGISINRKCIVVEHFGGSREKWRYIHRYRFQNNDWYLIGTTVSTGASCDYFYDFDYNLSTGIATLKYRQEFCNDDETKVLNNWKETVTIKTPLPLMDNFYPGDNEITFPLHHKEMYY